MSQGASTHECAHHAAARAEKTRAAQKGDPNRRLIWLVTKTPKSGEFCFGTFGEFYFGIDSGRTTVGTGRAAARRISRRSAAWS